MGLSLKRATGALRPRMIYKHILNKSRNKYIEYCRMVFVVVYVDFALYYAESNLSKSLVSNSKWFVPRKERYFNLQLPRP